MRHFAVLAALMAACGGEALPRVCESGRTQACACVGGGQGAQVCALSGLSWGACVCGDGGAADVVQTPADAPAMPDGGSDAATVADGAADATDGQAEAAPDGDPRCTPSTLRMCGSGCHDLQTSVNNCGACGNDCRPRGLVCRDGGCAP